MICLSLFGTSVEQLISDVDSAKDLCAYAEIRLDLCAPQVLEDLKTLVSKSALPLLLTYRRGNPKIDRDALFEKMSDASPYMIDFEIETDSDKLERFSKKGIKTLISWHGALSDFNEVKKIYGKMKKSPADLCKIAWEAPSSTEALKLFILAKSENQTQPRLIPVGLGVANQFLRVIGKVANSPFTFASLDGDKATGEGQLTASELRQTYRFLKLRTDTELYGLIGDPVTQSHSDKTHNKVFEKEEKNAVYVKMPVRRGEVAAFLPVAREAGFKGLSVTMPLKQELLKQEVVFELGALRAGAANTLKATDTGWAGSNTDGSGVVIALKEKINLSGKIAVILGAGGTAQSIAWNLAKEGVKVVILNRTPERGKELAKMIGAEYGPLSDIRKWKNSGYDILVQSTSIGMAPNIEDCPIPTSEILPEAIIFDVISNPPQTKLLKEADKIGCETIGGGVMFFYQALMQFERWFGTINPDTIRPIFEDLFQVKICRD